MSRYIDADAAIQWVEENECYTDKFKRIMEGVIDKQPTVEAVPVVHSAWKHEIDDMGIYRHHTVRCSNCKCGFTHAYVVLLCGDTGDLFKHCPNCGARMDGADGERRSDDKDD